MSNAGNVKVEMIYCKKDCYEAVFRDKEELIWKEGKWYKLEFEKHLTPINVKGYPKCDGVEWRIETEFSFLKMNYFEVKSLLERLKRSFYTAAQLRHAKLKQLNER